MIISDQASEPIYLPDDLLEQILDDAPALSSTISNIFERIVRLREEMRDALLASERLRSVEDLPTVDSPSVAAIDGGTVLEQSLGADTALVVALGIEGLMREGRQHWNGVQFVHWKQVLTRKGLNNRDFALGVMAALELNVLVNAPHEVVILDGSHITPVLNLNRMLHFNDAVYAHTAAALVAKHDVAANLNTALRKPEVVAMVKYDQTRDLTDTCLSDFESPCDDRTTLTMLLKEGEYTAPVCVGQTPRSADNWSHAHVQIAFADYPEKNAREKEFKDALAYLNERQIFFTYYKPHEWSPAYRIELKRETAADDVCLSRVLTAVREQVVSPEIREPYPQYLADCMAKSVSGGMVSLRAAVFHDLDDRSADDYMRFYVQSYRTEY